MILPLISAFFSSSEAFSDELKRIPSVPVEIRRLTDKWISEDIKTIEKIRSILDDPMDFMSRMVTVCDYLEQEAYDKRYLYSHILPERISCFVDCLPKYSVKNIVLFL